MISNLVELFANVHFMKSFQNTKDSDFTQINLQKSPSKNKI